VRRLPFRFLDEIDNGLYSWKGNELIAAIPKVRKHLTFEAVQSIFRERMTRLSEVTDANEELVLASTGLIEGSQKRVLVRALHTRQGFMQRLTKGRADGDTA
jgi:hypothetical protein